MSHVYSTTPAFKRWLVDNATNFGTASDTMLLELLVSVSTSIDAFCQRTAQDFAPSGFGPVIATHRYDGPREACLDLGDDLLSLTSISVRQSLGADPTTYTDETDFYKGPYDRVPYRDLELNSLGQTSWYGVRRGIAVVAKWGFQDVRRTLGTITGNITDSAATVPLSVAAEPGMTLYIGTEQLFVRAIGGTSNLDATVDRGVNGTTAAAHTSAAGVEYFVYPGPVVDCTNQVAQRRLKARDAGVTGDYGGVGQVPATGPRDSEASIMYSLLRPYRLMDFASI